MMLTRSISLIRLRFFRCLSAAAPRLPLSLSWLLPPRLSLRLPLSRRFPLRFLLPLLLLIFISGCQTFPRGERLEDLQLQPSLVAETDTAQGNDASATQEDNTSTSKEDNLSTTAEADPSTAPASPSAAQPNQQTNDLTNQLPNEPTTRRTPNEPTTQQNPLNYSLADLYRYYEMCRAVWRIRDSYEDTSWEMDFMSHEPTNTLAMTLTDPPHDGDALLVVFRGSQAPKNKLDLKYNIKFFPRRADFFPTPRIRAHGGFLEKYLGVREELLDQIATADAQRLQLVGHSGGGAMAAIAFMDLKSQFPELELKAVSFGMPRVFNRRGAAWFEPYRDDFLRIVNGRDPVPNLPPALFGFRHVGRLIRMGARPPIPIFTYKDHYPGYPRELEALLLQEGIDPADCF